MAAAMKWILSFISIEVYIQCDGIQCLSMPMERHGPGFLWALVLYSLMPLVALGLLAFYWHE